MNKSILHNKKEVALLDKNGKKHVFTNLTVKGCGGSFYVYNAIDSGSDVTKKGILKEFKNNINTSWDDYVKLLNICREFNFIPNLKEYSCEDDNSIHFIWDDYVTTFEEVCWDTNISFAEKLQCLIKLTTCIMVLHSRGYIHRDIKPANFGFTFINKNTINDVSLFDIDTIKKANENNGITSCSKWFCPEEIAANNDESVDVYSIGACLYYMFIVHGSFDVQDSEYSINNKNQYNYIEKLLKESNKAGNNDVFPIEDFVNLAKNGLSQNFKSDSCKNKFLNDVCDVIKRCFREGDGKAFSTCHELLLHLKRLYGDYYYYTNPEINKYDELKYSLSFDSRLSNNSLKQSIYSHLLKDPLCDVSSDDGSISIVLIGCGYYGSTFLDIVLQLGQCINNDIKCYVLADKADEIKKSYLGSRPDLNKFFIIDGYDKDIMFKDDDSGIYGEINFIPITFSKSKIMRNDNEILFSAITKHHKITPDYIFITFGNDVENKLLSTSISKCLGDKNKCVIKYAVNNSAIENSGYDSEGIGSNNCTTDVAGSQHFGIIEPVFINEGFNQDKSYDYNDLLSSMAFNVELSYDGSLSKVKGSNEEEKPKLKDRYDHFTLNDYNYNSCLQNALSIPYKLKYIDHSLKTDFSKINLLKIDDNLKKIFNDNKHEKFLTLAWMEHKRWVVEKLTEGFSKMSIEDAVNNKDTKDKKRRKHICLVPSTKNISITENMWNSDFHNDNFDHLDDMSIELNKMYHSKAEDKDNLINEFNILINRLDHSRVNEENKNIYYSIINLYNSCFEASQYVDFSDLFKNIINIIKRQVSDDEIINELLKLFEKLDICLYCNSQKDVRKDYKKIDFDLTKSIPKIIKEDWRQ